MTEPHDPRRGRNVYGEPLADCGHAPLTGFFRDGCCRTASDDAGEHTVCAVVTREFLEFSKSRGNDLSSPVPAYGFPGLSPGDRWCLCAARWKEALDAGCAPQVDTHATHESALRHVSLAELEDHAVPRELG